jgi:hypothetical protein
VHAELARPGELLVAARRADDERACTAAAPMPEPTELTSTVSPIVSSPRVKSMWYEVAKAIWKAAASTSVMESGVRMRWRSGIAAYSA